jgi:hypothetical protein
METEKTASKRVSANPRRPNAISLLESSTPIMGRPSKYTAEIAAEIIDRLASESLEQICLDAHMPCRKTVYNWQDDTTAHPTFYADCARARKRQAAAAEERVRTIAERCEAGEIDPKAAGVAISAHQWRAKVIDPQRYSDRLELAGDAANPLTVAMVIREERERRRAGASTAEPLQIEDSRD